MKVFQLIPLSAVAFFAACDSGSSTTSPFETSHENSSSSSVASIAGANENSSSSTLTLVGFDGNSSSSLGEVLDPNGNNKSSASSSPVPNGILQYERHLDKDSIASMKCEVYSTDESVILNLNISYLGEKNQIDEILEVNLGDLPSYYSEINYSGMFMQSSSKGCNTFKQIALEMNDANVTCTDNKNVITATIPAIYTSDKQTYIHQMVEKLKLQCDDTYTNTKTSADKMTSEFGNPNSSSDVGEKALSCNVDVNGNTMQTSIKYPDKSAIFTMKDMNGVFAMQEEYTGIDDATLAKVCEYYKKETDITNISCSGSTITYNSNVQQMVDIASYAEYTQKILCPAFLNGLATLDDMWYSED